MKVAFQFDDDTTVNVKHENLVLQNILQKDGNTVAVVGYVSPAGFTPMLSFPGIFFTPEGLKIHDAAIRTAASEATAEHAEKKPAQPEKTGMPDIQPAKCQHHADGSIVVCAKPADASVHKSGRGRKNWHQFVPPTRA